MTQHRLLTLEEELAIARKAFALRDQGKLEEYKQMRKQIPLQPYLAKFAKDHFGVDFLIDSGWNLAEAEAEFGSDWLTK